MTDHNESLASRESDESIEQTSKLKRFGVGVMWAGAFAAPVAITAASAYFGLKTQKMNYETAKLNLEVAKDAAEKIK